MKRTLPLLALLALTAFTLQAQQFEWAKNFYGYGDEYRNFPCGLVADSQGNTYHLMQVGSGGRLDGTDPFGDITNYNPSLLLVKRSPSGQYLWHRIINPWERGGESSVSVYDLRILGDTALMMMVDIPLPHTDFNPSTPMVLTSLYYLDTLLTTSEMLMPTDSIYHWTVTAFITLGLDGTLKEHHFLQVTYLDSLGQPVVCGNDLYSEGLKAEHFDVDSRGNIYLVRLPQDRAVYWGIDPLYLHDGSLSALRFMVDGTRPLTYIPPYRTGWWNQQVLKFSPHFDTLLDASYLIAEKSGVDWFNTQWLELNSFDIYNDQLYFTLQTRIDHDSMLIARSNGLHISVDTIARYSESGCLLRLDTGLNADLLMQFNYLPRPDNCWSGVILSATCVDTASGSLFLLGYAGTDSYSGNVNPHYFIYRDDTLPNRNDAFWLRVSIVDGHFLSYGHMHSAWGDSWSGLGIAARNNRVFAQLSYTGSVFFADTAFLTHGTSEKGLALAQWDYDGHEVAIYPLHSSHPKSIPGHILLLDTALYITGNSFNTPTSFGNIPCGMGQYIAKRGDTSMRSPYLYPDLHADQSIIWPGSDTLRIPHPETNPDLPLNATASSGLPVVYSLSDPSMALVRIDNDNMKLAAQCQRGVCQITATQPGTSYWNPASRTKTLIIGPMPQPPAAIDEPSTLNSHFSIYPNPVTDAVTLSSPEPLLSVHLTDLTGRKISTNALTQSSTNAITLDLSPLPQATYLLTLTTATGKTHTVKLLKISPLHP